MELRVWVRNDKLEGRESNSQSYGHVENRLKGWRERKEKNGEDGNVVPPSQQEEAVLISMLYFENQRMIIYMVDIAEFRSGRCERRRELGHTIKITPASKTGRETFQFKISVILVYY